MSRSTFLLVLKGIFLTIHSFFSHLTRSWSTKWAGKHSDAASTSAAGASQESRSILMRAGYSSPSRVLNSLENTSLVAILRAILRTAASLLFIYVCHIYPGVPHQCAALFSLGLLHYMHDKTNINQHTFSYNTVTTLTMWYTHA